MALAGWSTSSATFKRASWPREARTRRRGWPAIDRLADRGCLECERAAGIRAPYAFLRSLIDALRIVRGHARDFGPPDRGSREFIYLAQRLNFGATAISDCME